MNSAEEREKVAAGQFSVLDAKRDPAIFKRLFTLDAAALMRRSIARGNFEEVDLLLQSGFDPSYPVTPDRWNVFLFLVEAGKHQAVEDLLKAQQVNVDYKDYDGFSALQIAAGKGDLEMVRLLLRYGASYSAAVNIANSQLRSEVADLLQAEASRHSANSHE